MTVPIFIHRDKKKIKIFFKIKRLDGRRSRQ